MKNEVLSEMKDLSTIEIAGKLKRKLSMLKYWNKKEYNRMIKFMHPEIKEEIREEI